jgi:putative CocE/NonD family hydrolase
MERADFHDLYDVPPPDWSSSMKPLRPPRCHPWLALLVLALPCAGQQSAPPRAGTFVMRILETEVGRESFELLPDGWKTKGGFDLFGKVKSDFEITEQRAAGKTTVTFRGKQSEQDMLVEAALTPERFETHINKTPPKTLDLAGKPAPIPYQNIVWAYFIDIGQELARRVRAGALKAGDTLDVVELASATLIPLQVREFAPAQRVHGGEPLAILTFELTVAGTVEGTLVTSDAGLPLYFGVPSQKLDVVLQGYEDVQPRAEPSTIADSGAWRAQLSKPEHTLVLEKKVMAPMRDKIELAADVYRPEMEGKVPTILVRTPYGREQTGLVYGNYFAHRGYAVVSQDVRGRFDSGGAFEPMRHETEDGSDTLDWIAAQPWSDGNVGMIGGSYLGFVQWAAAKSGNPHLKALVPEVAPPDPQYNIPFLGGTFFLSSVWWARVVHDMSTLGSGGEKLDWMAKLATLPLTDLDKAFGIEPSFLDDWLAHPPHDPWWEPQSYQKNFAEMDVPALHVSGWYDGDQPGAPMNYVGMRAHAKSERARTGQQLLFGPWTHLFNTASRIGTLDFGKDALIDLDSVTLRWFDHYLKGIDNGVEREDPVLVFTMVENQWHREKDWPLPETRWTKLFLGGKGTANRRDGGGTLALASEAGSAPDHYAYDPARMPDVAIDFDDLSGAQATRDSAQDPDRDDVLDFTSPPLAHAVELTGPFSAVLSVTTDAKDTDFVVGLMRIQPDGRMLELRGGVQRLRYRSGYAREDFAKPGEVSTLTIDLWATGIRLAAGERLRVEVQSSAFPGTARNLNTGEPDATATRMVVAHQTLFHDEKRPSYVLLPVIPREGLGELAFAADGQK